MTRPVCDLHETHQVAIVLSQDELCRFVLQQGFDLRWREVLNDLSCQCSPHPGRRVRVQKHVRAEHADAKGVCRGARTKRQRHFFDAASFAA